VPKAPLKRHALEYLLSLPDGIFKSVQASSPTTFSSIKKKKKEDYFKSPCRVLTTLSTNILHKERRGKIKQIKMEN